ncbi:MAG: hydrolase, TatD family [Chloroflexi bacterium]|nr:hydrolase, TatD family [Chloroflexota bacterium]
MGAVEGKQTAAMDYALDVTRPFVDTHAHFMIDNEETNEMVIARARAAGLQRILAPAIDRANADVVLRVAAQHDDVFAAVGIHPNSVDSQDDFDHLRKLAEAPRVRAIGETGLDYYRTHTSPELQHAHLTRHMQLAADLGLPIILHNREADDDIYAIAQTFSDVVHGVMHCFSSTWETALRFLDLGYYISFAGNITYPSAGPLREVASRIPADRILSETDSPYLTPVPYRGKRNEPSNVVLTVESLAQCRNTTPAELANQIAANAERLFGW